MKEEESAVAAEKIHLKYDHELLPAWASTSFLALASTIQRKSFEISKNIQNNLIFI